MTSSWADRLGLVLKADGLAAGKGVYVCDNLRQALEAIDQIMIRRIFGQAGDRLIIEERLDGQEASVLAITDGRTIIPLESSQDYKRAFDHDEGPNTGGHGGVLADRDRHSGADGTGRARDPGPGDPRAEASPPTVPRRALRGLDAHQPGPQGPRIQRPLRRPRNPGRAHAAEDRPVRAARSRRRRAARLRFARVGPATGGDGRHGLGGLPRAITSAIG